MYWKKVLKNILEENWDFIYNMWKKYESKLVDYIYILVFCSVIIIMDKIYIRYYVGKGCLICRIIDIEKFSLF